MDRLLYKDLEPGIINAEMIRRAVQLHKGEAGRLFKLVDIAHEKITILRLEFQNILKIDHLWMLPNLKVLSLSNNKIEKIENLDTLSKLTDLNLSYNHIETIENLKELRTLEILSVYGNHIERIENMENLENLIIFSAGNNRIKTVKGIERLRFIKTLRSLNLQGNPIVDQDFHLYISVILCQLKYYAYVHIKQEDREKGAVLFRREVRETEEFERSEISEREEAAQETVVRAQLIQCLVENLSRYELFDSLFEDDHEAESLLSVGSGGEELVLEYRKEAFVITQTIYIIGLAQHQRRKKEVDLFQDCIDNGRRIAQMKEQKFVKQFLKSKTKLYLDAAEAADFAKPLSAFLEDLTTKFNDLLKQTWDALMDIEVELFERIEDNIKDFNHIMRDMMRQFFEEVQVQFVLFREAEKSFANSLIDVVQEFVTTRSIDDMPELLLASLNDKDFVDNLGATMKENHLKQIDAREDKLFERGTEWTEKVAQQFLSEERSRNRAKISEINHLIDYQRIAFEKLLSKFENGD